MILITLLAALAAASPLEDGVQAKRWGDYETAIRLFRQEVEKGNPEAARRLGGEYKYGGGGVPADPREAFRLFTLAEKGGDPIATYELYWAYETGMGVEKSTKTAAAFAAKAIPRLIAAAGKGDWEAAGRLSNMHNNGFGAPKNPSEAAKWAERELVLVKELAKSGDPYYEYYLGFVHEYAPAGLRDVEAAAQSYKRAADKGYPPAMHSYAGMLRRGQGVEKDEAAAAALFEKSAELGYVWGWHALADMAASRGDHDAKVKWLRKAAATSATAAWQLAGHYRGAKEHGEAMRWAYKAAKAGSGNGMGHLAEMYENGDGVAKDPAEAYKWNRLLAWAGDYMGKVRLEKLDKALSPAEKAEGLKRAKETKFEAYPLGKPYPRPAGLAAAPAPVPEAPKAAPAARLPERKDDFALIVGIERYRGLPSADYAESDAAAMRARLVALGFPERNVVSLVGADATRSKLSAYLEEWLPRNAGKDANVFFYFSGHGAPDPKSGQAYLVPADGDPAFLKSTAYPLKDLYASLSALPAKRVVVALDSCFSGAGGRSVLAKGMRPLVGKVEQGASGAGKLVVLAAAAGDQTTGGLDASRSGAFTHFLLKGLEGEAKDGEGRITAGSLSAYLSPKVADEARRQNREQTPQLYGDPAAVLFNLR